MNESVYLGNPNLKKANVQQEWTKEELEEYARCMKDPIYFIRNYIKIVSLDEGLVPFELYDFQKEMVGTFHNNRFTICKLPRQSGKSTTIIAYLLHYVLFNPSVNVAILANKAATARDLLGRLQLAYEHMPKWLQQGVMSWNKGSLELEMVQRYWPLVRLLLLFVVVLTILSSLMSSHTCHQMWQNNSSVQCIQLFPLVKQQKL